MKPLYGFAHNESVVAEYYIDKGDEHHYEHIAGHAQATFYDNFTQIGKLMRKQDCGG